jgi:hypothetical protein
VWLSFDSITCKLLGTPDTAAMYVIKVTAIDTAGASVSCTFKITVTNPPSGIEEEIVRFPQGFTLDQNYPNPFNPKTVISYQVSVISDVKLSVYDVLGREIAVLINNRQNAGIHTTQWNAANLPSGVYFYQLKAGTYTETKKLLLLK